MAGTSGAAARSRIHRKTADRFALMMKQRRGNFFEDFRLGQVFLHAAPRTLGDGDASLYIALTGARHVLASSRPTAVALGYRDRPIDDLLAFHIAFGKTVADISLNAIANLGYADVRFLLPVYAWDTLAAESEVIGLRQNANGKSGVVWVRSTISNQHGQAVLTWVRRGCGAACGGCGVSCGGLAGQREGDGCHASQGGGEVDHRV